ncbi:MAG: methyltransferase [Kiritimatiellae bacterium]|nr:methyltransferase [Kiritimatiellia bacterium]
MKTLLVGYAAKDLFETLKHGKTRTASWLTPDVTCHCLDIYNRHAIEKVHHAKAICSAHLPEGPWDEIRFRTGPKLMSGELSLDILQEIHALAPDAPIWGGKGKTNVVVDFVGKERDRNDLISKIKDDPDRVRSFASTWEASVPEGKPVTFTSFPGCFCHRRMDEGGLALAEVALQRTGDPEASDTVHGGCRVLDMGCGCGLVGLLMASVRPAISLVMVDSHSRAVEAAALNAKNQGVEAEVILSDSGTPARMDGTFDVFVGNPPYYSDYRIAEVFLETAKRALKPGGQCFTVCKNAAGLEPVQKRYFPEVEVIKRRGYAVLKSIC